MASPGKQLSPSELAALEHAFAADPSSDAYRPLAEAYLAMGRFMEAMVVCKKGVKAHPSQASARVLLARVYADQGKDRKALEELQAALQVEPNDVAANRMAGLIYMKLGEAEQGTAALKKAADAAPGDAETIEALKKWGVVYQPGANGHPAGEAETPAAEVTDPDAGAAEPAAADNGQTAPAPAPRPAAPKSGSTPAVRPAAPKSGSAPAARPAAPRSGTAKAAPAAAPKPKERAAEPEGYDADELRERYATNEYALPKKKGLGAAARTLGILVILAIGLAGWVIYSQQRKARAIEIDKLLRQTRDLVDKDTYGGYKQAAKQCDEILRLDGDSVAGHAYLGYVETMLWGEHREKSGDRDLKADAVKHLKAARKLTDSHSHIFAAEALASWYGDRDARSGIDFLNKVLKGQEGGQSSLLLSTLGFLQMQAGELETAKESLANAVKYSGSEARPRYLLAEQYRRRGAGYEPLAWDTFTAASKLSPEHAGAQLGIALMLLNAGQNDEALKKAQKVIENADSASPKQVAQAHLVKSYVLFGKNEKKAGQAEEDQAFSMDRESADLFDLLGKRKLRDGMVDEAIKDYQRASQMEPQRVMFYVHLADALLKKPGGVKQAIEHLKKAAEQMKDNGRIRKLLGDAYASDGDADRARSEYERAVEMEKIYPEAHMALGSLYKEKKDWGRALDEYEKAAKDWGDKNASDAFSAIAVLEEARNGKPEKIDEYYRKAITVDPTNCDALWYLGKKTADERKKDPGKLEFAKKLLGDYVQVCGRWPHAADAQKLLATLK